MNENNEFILLLFGKIKPLNDKLKNAIENNKPLKFIMRYIARLVPFNHNNTLSQMNPVILKTEINNLITFDYLHEE